MKRPRKIKLRAEVQWFAERMEDRLRRHDDDRGSDGWKGEDYEWLLERLKQEVSELEKALPNKKRAVIEAADVANFAMMISDVVMS